MLAAGFDLDGAELTILAPAYVEAARLDAARQNDGSREANQGDRNGHKKTNLG